MINFVNDIAKINKKDRYDAIINILNRHGIIYKIQPVTATGALGNIIVSLNAKEGEKKIVFGSHYDNCDGTPGANDNAAACSILLNLILYIKLERIEKYIEVVFFDMEETKEHFGSCEYLKTLNNAEVVFNLDMCGIGNNTCVCAKNLSLAKKFKYADQYIKIKKFAKLPPSDADIFNDYGIPTILVINSTDNDLNWFGDPSRWKNPYDVPDFGWTMHRPSDTPDKVNTKQMEKILGYLLDCIAD